jgi:protein gp37
MGKTKISWATDVWNAIVGCSRISPGCDNCYAANLAKSARLQQFTQYQEVQEWNGKIAFVPSQITKPFKSKTPQLFFLSMSDPGHHNVKLEYLDRMFAVMAIANEHQFLFLSKRPKAMKAYIEGLTADRLYEASKYFWNQDDIPKRLWRPLALLREYFNALEFPIKNVWIGTSVENQEVADRILDLKATPAHIRFLSCEPLLERVDLRKYLGICVGCQSCEFRGDHLIGKPMVDWVICGGESAQKRDDARPCHLDWLRSIVHQCQMADVPVSVKQLGSNPIDSRMYIDGVAMTTFQVKVKDHTDLNEFPEELRWRQHPVF